MLSPIPEYKHYSFDLWLTLIRSNPLFKQHRSIYFHQHYNWQQKPLAEVEAAFRQVDLMANAVNERTGKNIDSDELYLMVISIINDNKVSLADIDTDALYMHMEGLLMEHLPLVYCNRTPEVLATLKQDTNNTISILSNTGFTKGCTLRKVLQELDIARYFDFQLYSDEAGMSKPNPAFFRLMLEEVAARRQLTLAEIIHIGDNPRADIGGANAVGISSLLVNSNDTSIVKLITHDAQSVLTI